MNPPSIGILQDRPVGQQDLDGIIGKNISVRLTSKPINKATSDEN